MPEIGQTISHYRILEKIGQGGMGEVYLADDTTLGRKVALKFLPDVFTGDPERMARFEREAKLLASLNQPNIAAIYGLEQVEGKRFLVMEYVEGETLQARISKGALPVEDTLAICCQIAEGLGAAHEKGVIHRDLKPANVMITAEEKVKILDFGLAKALLDERQSVDSSQSPTITEAMTQPGVVLGTAAYMSPEQAKGKPVDKRADIWAFGCILYECLTGKKIFGGETVTETLAAVLRADPDWDLLPANIPQNIWIVLQRSLERDKNRRLRDASDIGIEIEEGLAAPIEMQDIPQTKSRRGVSLLAAAAVLFILGGAIAWILKPLPVPTAQSVTRLEYNLPPGDRVDSLYPLIAVSPDGGYLAYAAIHNGMQQIFVRSLDSYEVRALAGTEGAYFPFFSPDSAWIGFFAQGQLKKAALDGGSIVPLCDTGSFGGASWGSDGTIVFSDSLNSGLLRVSSDGGEPRVLTDVDRDRGENSHRMPQFLPGRQALLFTVLVGGGGWNDFEIWALKLDTGEKHRVLPGGHTGRFVPTGDSTGHLVYYREDDLWALPFDPIRLEVIGESPVPKPIAEGIMRPGGIAAGDFSISTTGVLAYFPTNRQRLENRLVWIDRNGNVEPVAGDPVRTFQSANNGVGVSVDPDGGRAAVQIESGSTEIWVLDLVRGGIRPFSSEAGGSAYPIWTPDGKRIVYTGFRKGFRNIYWKNADGTGEEARLTTGPNHQYPVSFSPDGKHLVFGEVDPKTGNDIWVLHLDEDRRQEPLHNTTVEEFMGHLSPDGCWLAYSSLETGQPEVYVESFPDRSHRQQISTEGGLNPLWSHNSPELFYRNGNEMMVVRFKTEPVFNPDKPRLLFEKQFGPGDIAPDGRFLMVQALEPEQPATKINFVLNWFEELKQKVPLP